MMETIYSSEIPVLTTQHHILQYGILQDMQAASEKQDGVNFCLDTRYNNALNTDIV
jgi:hypothetical protein